MTKIIEKVNIDSNDNMAFSVCHRITVELIQNFTESYTVSGKRVYGLHNLIHQRMVEN